MDRDIPVSDGENPIPDWTSGRLTGNSNEYEGQSFGGKNIDQTYSFEELEEQNTEDSGLLKSAAFASAEFNIKEETDSKTENDTESNSETEEGKPSSPEIVSQSSLQPEENSLLSDTIEKQDINTEQNNAISPQELGNQEVKDEEQNQEVNEYLGSELDFELGTDITDID
jgi:hypothetical protein